MLMEVGYGTTCGRERRIIVRQLPVATTTFRTALRISEVVDLILISANLSTVTNYLYMHILNTIRTVVPSIPHSLPQGHDAFPSVSSHTLADLHPEVPRS